MAVWSESMHVYQSVVNAHCNNYSYDIEVCIFDYNTHNIKSTFTRRPLFFGIYRLPDDWYYIHETMVVQMTWVWTFSTLIAIIRACARWALFVVTLTNTVHLIYIYIYLMAILISVACVISFCVTHLSVVWLSNINYKHAYQTQIVIRLKTQQFHNWPRFDQLITDIKSENFFIFTTLDYYSLELRRICLHRIVFEPFNAFSWFIFRYSYRNRSNISMA